MSIIDIYQLYFRPAPEEISSSLYFDFVKEINDICINAAALKDVFDFEVGSGADTAWVHIASIPMLTRRSARYYFSEKLPNQVLIPNGAFERS